jgi:hypothetical protein
MTSDRISFLYFLKIGSYLKFKKNTTELQNSKLPVVRSKGLSCILKEPALMILALAQLRINY